MQIGNVDLKSLRFLADKSFGLTKEFVGYIANNERLQEEGQAQQERGSKELKALKEELKAEKNRAEARVQEGRQRAAQKAKESANA